MQLPRGAIFDMDGTLLESEKLARACFIRACADIGWPEVDIAIYDRCVGSTHDATRNILVSGYGPEFPIDKMLEVWSEHYRQHIQQHPLEIKPGIVDLLGKLQALGVPMAVATSSLRPTTETKLTKTNLLNFFDHLVCGGEAAKGKPDPAPYLMAADRLGVPPAECWGIEDSDNGLRSARAAGLQVFQIPDEIPPSDEVRNFGHPILTSVHILYDFLADH